MRKKDRNRNIIIGTLILIGIIALVYFGGGGKTFSLQTLSISNVDIIDQGARILVYATNGGGEALQITFSPSTLNSFLKPDGYEATNTSILNAKIIEQQINIPFSTAPTYAIKEVTGLQEYNYRPYPFYFESCSRSFCEGKIGTSVLTFIDTSTTLNPKCSCVGYINKGEIHAFNSGYSAKKFKIEFDLDGQKAYLQDSSPSINIGSTKITFAGSLLNNNDIGVPNYDVYNEGTILYLVDKNAYSSISSGWANLQASTRNGVTFSSYQNLLAEYVNDKFNAISKMDSNYKREVPGVNSISFSTGTMMVDLNQPSFLPTYTIELDATKVGIIKLSGVPRIDQCIPAQTFSESGSQTAISKITNIGKQEGTFDISVTCNKDEMSGVQLSLDFDVSQTKDVSVLLYGGNPGTTTNCGDCVLTVKDRNSPTKTKTCTFGICVDYESDRTECTGTETKCSSDQKSIFRCVNKVFKKESCPSGTKCVYENGNQAVCKEGGIITNGTKECESCDAFALSTLTFGLWESKKCEPQGASLIPPKLSQTYLTCAFSFIKLLLIPIVLVFTLLYGMDWLERFRTLKGTKKKGTRFIVSLLFGLLFAYITFILFWFGILVLILLIVLRMGLSRIGLGRK